MEQVRSDDRDFAAVEHERSRHRSAAHVDDADHDRRLSRPFEPFPRGVDRAAVRANPRQAGRARIVLPNRVRRDQAEAAAIQARSASE